MRRKSLLHFTFGLLLFASIGISHAQQFTLMQYSNQWSYLITNAMPAGWSASNYPAANGWPQGAGVLAFPLNEPMPAGVPAPLTVLATNYNNSTFVTSFYFRTSITLTSNPNSLSITGLAVIDDGGVLYVNGREITPRFRMPSGALTYFTFASAGGEVSTRAIDQFSIASSNFVQGVNVIAAEVHQDAGTSSDVVFGLSLIADGLPAIVTQPQSQTVDAGRTATFTVSATGAAPLTYRWYSNSVPLSASGASYTTPLTTLAMNGTTYYVTVSNRFGIVQSSNAVLTVELDDNGPQLILGVNVPNQTNQVEVTFDEVVAAPSATNKANWAVFILGTTNSLTVTNTLWGSQKVRVYTLEPLDPSSNYVVCAYNQRDTKSTSNLTAQTCIGIGFLDSDKLISFGEMWRYDDNEYTAPPTNFPAAVDWKQVNYIDDPFQNFLWYENFAPLRDEQNPTTPLCEVHDGGSLGRGPNTYYFRKLFRVTENYGSNASVTLRFNVDDGAVFYLNGTEIYRVNLPTQGAISYGTMAVGCTEGACQTTAINNIANLFRVGTNVLAVEVHQCTESDPVQIDCTFDAELSVSFRNPPIVPRLNIARQAIGVSTNIVLTWTGQTNIWRIEQATNLAGPWSPVSTPRTTNRLSTPWLQAPGPRFYRLKNP